MISFMLKYRWPSWVADLQNRHDVRMVEKARSPRPRSGIVAARRQRASAADRIILSATSRVRRI